MFKSGTFSRTFPVESALPFFAQNEIPAYFEASYASLGSTKFIPSPEKTIAPGADRAVVARRVLRAVAPLAHREGAALVARRRLHRRRPLVLERVPVPAPVVVRQVLVVPVFAVVDQTVRPAVLADLRSRRCLADAAGAAAPPPIDAADPGATCGCVADLSGMTQPSASNVPPASTTNALFASLFI